MRKLIKGITELIGMMLALAGLVVCMCETENLDKQFATLVIGLGMFLLGVLICYLMNRGKEDVYFG